MELSEGRLRADVTSLLGPHSRLASPDLMDRFGQTLHGAFEEAGWPVEEQSYTLRGVRGSLDYGEGSKATFEQLSGRNILAIKPGMEHRKDAFVVVAHYDTRRDTPGADDNIASVASLLELARLLRFSRFRRTVILAAVDHEEIGMIGSGALVPWLESKYNVVGAVVLETVAYTDNKPRTLKLESKPGRLYHDQFVRMAKAEWSARFTLTLYRARGTSLAATFTSAFELFAGDGLCIPARDPGDLPLVGLFIRRFQREFVRQFHRSDHVPFWEAGIPAIQVTDGANFSNPHYHAKTDLPETLDFGRLADVTLGTAVTVADRSGFYGD